MPSFYVPELSSAHSTITISGSEHHHITKVFRFTEGKEIFLNSGKGIYVRAKITEIQKKTLSCQVIESIQRDKYNPDIAVAFSLLRNKNDHLLVEKLTELGVAEFFPFESDYSVRKASNNTTDKFKITAIEAIKQCDNGYLPIVDETKDLKAQLAEIENKNYNILVASEKELSVTLKDIISNNLDQPVCVVIGPEGGFSLKEFKFFTDREYQQYKLGINILRAETAAICAVSQIINILL